MQSADASAVLERFYAWQLDGEDARPALLALAAMFRCASVHFALQDRGSGLMLGTATACRAGLPPEAAMVEAQFCQIPAGEVRLLADGMGLAFPAAHATAYLALLRGGDGAPFTPVDQGRLRLLLPMLARAVSAAARIEQLNRNAEDMATVLKELPLPCVVTDQAGRCLEPNAAFLEQASASRIRLVTGRIRFANPEDQSRWEEALFQVHATGVGHALQLNRPDGGVWRLQLRPWHDALETGGRQILVVFDGIGEPARPERAPLTAQLTRAELDVLAGLLKGMPAKSIASLRGASVNTVRTQIMSILEKTGYHSQKELIASFAASGFSESSFFATSSHIAVTD